MKNILVILLMILSTSAIAADKCMITVKLSQTHYTLDLWEHAKDAMNAVKFKLPVDCQFYNEVNIGDDLLTEDFRTGSLLINGSVGDWNLEVVDKNVR